MICICFGKPGNNVAAAVPDKVAKQIRKIRDEAPATAAAFQHTVDNDGALPGKESTSTVARTRS